MNVSRRALLHTTWMVPAGLLTGCATPPTPAPPLVSQIATGANLIASGLDAALSQVIQIPGIKADDVAKLEGYLMTVEDDARQIAAATAAPTTSTLQEIQKDAQAVLSVAAPYLPAGSLILPIINAAIDLASTLVGNVGARPGAYSETQARSILAHAHASLGLAP